MYVDAFTAMLCWFSDSCYTRYFELQKLPELSRVLLTAAPGESVGFVNACLDFFSFWLEISNAVVFSYFRIPWLKDQSISFFPVFYAFYLLSVVKITAFHSHGRLHTKISPGPLGLHEALWIRTVSLRTMHMASVWAPPLSPSFLCGFQFPGESVEKRKYIVERKLTQ